MTLQVAIMYAVAAVATIIGVGLLLRLRTPAITERKVYAYRMIGIMLTSGGIVLAMSATAMWRWSVTP